MLKAVQEINSLKNKGRVTLTNKFNQDERKCDPEM